MRRLLLGLSAWIRRCCSPTNLGLVACFEEEWGGTSSRRRLGLKEVEVSEIVGSVGRCREFDREFRPVRRGLEARWDSVCRALCTGNVLPPVQLYKVGSAYFVRDGNHRVSVSRYRGALVIGAEVTELISNGVDG